jgi:UDP-N-acetyl-D-mannosaminuronate dehydrogenase
MTKCISVVGLGKLGLCLAACFAEKGFETIDVDVDERVISAINRGVPYARNRVYEILGECSRP